MHAFIRNEGYYRGLPQAVRAAQVAHLVTVAEQLYPRLRLYLFDARRLYSAPVTIFGPLLAAVYIGQNYMVFRDSERVQALSAHFDRLVREADVTARALPDHVRALWASAGGDGGDGDEGGVASRPEAG